MEDRDGDCSICEGGEEAHAPVRLVAGAYRHFVPLLQTALLKAYVQVRDSDGDVPVAHSGAAVIGQSLAVPVLLEAFFEQFVYNK